MSHPTVRTVIPAEDVLVLALLEARAIATFLLIALHNPTVALATAQETEIVTAMSVTETEIGTATATVSVKEKKTATRIVTEIAKRTAIVTETENVKEKENVIATETAIVAAEKTTDQRLIVTYLLPAPVPLVETAKKLSANAIAHAREAAMLGRTATSFESRRGCLAVMSMRCISSIRTAETDRLQGVYEVRNALW
jgi:hypothetical protein